MGWRDTRHTFHRVVSWIVVDIVGPKAVFQLRVFRIPSIYLRALRVYSRSTSRGFSTCQFFFARHLARVRRQMGDGLNGGWAHAALFRTRIYWLLTARGLFWVIRRAWEFERDECPAFLESKSFHRDPDQFLLGDFYFLLGREQSNTCQYLSRMVSAWRLAIPSPGVITGGWWRDCLSTSAWRFAQESIKYPSSLVHEPTTTSSFP